MEQFKQTKMAVRRLLSGGWAWNLRDFSGYSIDSGREPSREHAVNAAKEAKSIFKAQQISS